jgi:predicted transcriptional regulator of viral defense system
VQTSPIAHQSVIEVAKQTPKAVICPLSALELHAVGVQAPFEAWIALPAGGHARKGGNTSIRVTRLSGGAFTEVHRDAF